MPTEINRFTNCAINAINPYHWITWLRNRAFDLGWLESRSFGVPVICIGNITVGGTGKTPHTEYLIRLLQKKYRLAVLSRGYGRKSRGYIKSNNNTTVASIGDEPFQMASKFKNITVAVDEKRAHGIDMLMREISPEVILLDDAYQHRYVKAGQYILLIDHSRPIWEDMVLPFGRLREASSGKERAQIVIVTKCPDGMSLKEQKAYKEMIGVEKPIFFTTMSYGNHYPMFPHIQEGDTSLTAGTKVLLVTGIARPTPLKKELEKRGAKVELMQYADHHNFIDEELAEISKQFHRIEGSNKMIVTTEKDATRLKSHPGLPDNIKKHIFVMPIEVTFLNNEANLFNQIILDYVTENQRDSRIS